MKDQTALHIESLRYRYAGSPADSGWVVDVTALNLDPGEQMLLTGGSGTGKSTLLSTIAGLHDPQEGRVEIDGTNLHTLRGAKRDRFRGQHIGMIFQNFNLLHGFSARENVMAAQMFSKIAPREHTSRAADLLTRLDITEFDKDVDRFSIGQQQRIAVARALACDPVLVLADEPTASLDPENSSIAISLIQELCKEKNAALLCTSHDPALRQTFDRRQSLDELKANAATSPATATEGA